MKRYSRILFLFIAAFGIFILQQKNSSFLVCESFAFRIPPPIALKRNKYWHRGKESLLQLSQKPCPTLLIGFYKNLRQGDGGVQGKSASVCLSSVSVKYSSSGSSSSSQDDPHLITSPSIQNNIDKQNEKDHFQDMNISLTLEAIRNITLSLNKDQVMRLPSDERYRYRIKQLLEYNNTFGTLDVPYNYKDDIQFAKWVQSQRYEYRLLRCKKVGVKSYLTPERVKLLDSIGFPWNDFRGTEQEGLSNRWMSNWNVLHEYKQEYGHVRVPENCVYRDVKLGIWVKNQRRYAKIYAKECRTQQRIEKLEELGFIWDTSQVGDTVYNATWMNRYEQVKDFYETHGHFCVPKTQRELALWMRTQRTMKQQLEDDPSKGDLYGTSRQYLKERIQLLNDINFDWDGMKAIERQRNQIWWQRYHELCRFYEYYGHTNTAAVVKLTQNATSTIPNFRVDHHDIDLNRLYRWTKTQRVRYKEFRRLLLTSDDAHERMKSINQDKINALARLGFVWDQREELWQSKFQKLKRFGEIHKHFNVPTSMSSPAFDELLVAVMNLKNDTTDKDREAYMKEMVHLGKWAYSQRFKFRKYKRGERLSFRTEQHMQLLEEISFCNETMVDHNISNYSSIVTPPRGASPQEKNFLWDSYFTALKIFQQENGHCRVPFSQDDADIQHLHEWTTFQRRRFRSVIKRVENNQHVSQVDLDRLDRLKKIGFIFNLHDYKFEAGLKRLEEYYTKYGHCKVCPNDTVADPRLYTFVRRQRHLYREREKGFMNSLCDERIEKLSRLGFVWNPRNSREAM